MEFMEVLGRRCSIRSYKPDPVEEEKILAIAEAGRLAPTAKNDQNWYCIAVKDDTLRHDLLEACANQPMVGQAPVILVVCGRRNRQMLCGQSTNSLDCAIAMTYIILKATELGLGSCWLGRFHADKVKEVLGIPEEDTVVAVTPLGYPAEPYTKRPRKELGEFLNIR